MKGLRRRQFLVRSALGAGAVSIPLTALISRKAKARDYGDLVPDPDGILDLPRGFTYQILEEDGDPMDDGYVVPARPDGMACFDGGNGTLVLMRNHENDTGGGAYGSGEAPKEAYDTDAYGGVTRLVVDAETGERISSNLVLTGTNRNCAGGPSPWGWLTCEENVDTGHGYVFVCPIDAETVQEPDPKAGYGRFNHEAAVVDPETNICYLTEDRGDSCVYRFVPDDPAEPFSGKLQALRVVGEDQFETTGMQTGEVVDIDWVDIDEPDPSGDTVRDEAQDKGAAIFVRGEGIFFSDGAVYVCSTTGGPVGGGQIFRIYDTPGDASMELLVQSEDTDVLQMPDNIVVSPFGQLFMAEDGGGDNHVRALTEDGEVIPFARNAASGSELAGVCFSPDGRFMFVNMQSDGLTLAITGPFPEVPDDPGGTGTGGETDGGTDSGGSDGSGSASGADTSAGSNSASDSASGGSASAGDESSGGAGSAGTESGTDSDGMAEGTDDAGGCGCSSTDGGGRGLAALGALAAGLVAKGRSSTDP